MGMRTTELSLFVKGVKLFFSTLPFWQELFPQGKKEKKLF